ncbi:unnamed protein product [Natator depressus]
MLCVGKAPRGELAAMLGVGKAPSLARTVTNPRLAAGPWDSGSRGGSLCERRPRRSHAWRVGRGGLASAAARPGHVTPQVPAVTAERECNSLTQAPCQHLLRTLPASSAFVYTGRFLPLRQIWSEK